jgi:hypothetical protein
MAAPAPKLSAAAAGLALVLSAAPAHAERILPAINTGTLDKGEMDRMLTIYEARDLDLDQNDRKSFGDIKNVDQAKERLGKTVGVLDTVVGTPLGKGAFLDARSGLRRAVGTIRYDINAVAATKANKNELKQEAQALYAKIEALDLELVSVPPAKVPNKEKASAAYDTVVADLDAIVAKLG